jgi:predicted ATPase
VAALEELLGTSRLVTVTGSSGIGKTRLALEVTARVAGAYANGAWLVELSSIAQPEVISQAVASALGLDPEPGREPADAVVARLSDAHALLVLDNCEHVLAAAASLATRLLDECPRVRVLATSQQPLGGAGERITALSPLSLPPDADRSSPEEALESEAVALFCARATATNPSFALTYEVLPAVRDICRRLDGIPLAIELAAARIVALGAEDIAERLHDRFRLLATTSPSAEPRHRTLQAALDWSYELLSSGEATLLRRMSVFAGGATLHAVEEVCTGKGAPRDEAVDLLTSLVAKSLVVADTTKARARYRLLETVRAYGHDRIVEAGEVEAVRARHATWCVSVVERAWHQVGAGNERYWVTTLEAEHDNLRAALDWAIGAKSPLALRLAGALTLFWRTRGYLQEGQEWLRRALDALPEAAPAARARALFGLGLLAIMRGEVATARAAVEESLTVARASRLRRAEAQALNLLGFISIFAQDAVAAKPVLEESVAMARADGDVGSVISSLALYGRAHLLLGDLHGARDVFQEARGLAERSGDTPAAALIGLGWVTLCAGELRRSEELFRQALTLLGGAGNRFETALVLSFLGQLAATRGKWAEATALLEEGRRLAVAMGAPFPLARCLYGLAEVALAERDMAGAAAMADEACRVASDARLPYALCRALVVRGDVRRATGDVDAARAAYEEALSVGRASADAGGVASSLTRLARVARTRGADDDGVTLLCEAIALQLQHGDGGLAGSLEVMAGLAVEHGRAAVAAGLFGAAQAMRAASGSVRPPWEVAGYEADLAALDTALDGELDAAMPVGRRRDERG